ncbi:M15 family metallopeptidase [Methylocaldum sp.]|uniref:M15 family metallopeptidase n=1 Tax=Methylocaldum sp. TaxID=1969727 RepID=UPI002D597A23|nr:M15 family metallopeptidase [Methylocaldum sp.]HYE38239.1 M15 family metallopeptidase [Methylocaldum sp.]
MKNLVNANRLAGVNAQLVAVVIAASGKLPFPVCVVEGVRSKARQAQLYAQGRTAPGRVVTWTLKSKHIDGLAVDLAPYIDGKIDWNDLKKFDAIAQAMFAAAAERGAKIRWGADWDADGKSRERGESDSPHFELVGL